MVLRYALDERRPPIAALIGADLKSLPALGQEFQQTEHVPGVASGEADLRDVMDARRPASEAVVDRPALIVRADVEAEVHGADSNAAPIPAQSQGYA